MGAAALPPVSQVPARAAPAEIRWVLVPVEYHPVVAILIETLFKPSSEHKLTGFIH